MDKYGVLKEYTCDCGYRVFMRDNNTGLDMIKEAGVAEEGHVHILKEVEDGQRLDKSTDIRSEQP